MDEVKEQFAKRAEVISRNGSGSDKGWLPDYTRCVSIATKASVIEMIIRAGAMDVFFPLIVGFLFGAKALAFILIGSIAGSCWLSATPSRTHLAQVSTFSSS